MNTRGGLNTSMDIENSGLHDINEEDMESREKPKVTYICGGNSFQTSFREILICFSSRLWKGQQTRQGLSDQMQSLRPQNLLQEEREKATSI